MRSKDFKYPDTQAFEFVVSRLESLGVTIADIADIAYQQQHRFGTIPLTQAEYVPVVEHVMHKRELLNNAMVMLELDRLANEQRLDSPLQEIIANDFLQSSVLTKHSRCRLQTFTGQLESQISDLLTIRRPASSSTLIQILIG